MIDHMDQDDLKKAFANPYYAITLNKSLTADHEPIVDEGTWIKVNIKLIKEIGEEEWLKRLLEVLKAKN